MPNWPPEVLWVWQHAFSRNALLQRCLYATPPNAEKMGREGIARLQKGTWETSEPPLSVYLDLPLLNDAFNNYVSLAAA